MRHFWLIFAIAMIVFTVYSVSARDTVGSIFGGIAFFSALILWWAEI